MSTDALVLGCLFLAGMISFVAYLLNRRDDMEQVPGGIANGDGGSIG